MGENIIQTNDMYTYGSLQKIIGKMIDEVARLESTREGRVSAEATREIFVRKIPFSEKVSLLKDEFNKIGDQRIRDAFLLRLEDFRKLEANASKGLTEMERLVKHTRLQDKDRFIDFIHECRLNMNDPCSIQISRSVYTQFVSLMNERRNNGLFEKDGEVSDRFIHTLGASDGTYYILTTTNAKPFVDQMLRAAAISCAKLKTPTKQDLEMEIMTRYGKKDGLSGNRAATFVFRGFSPEFAEKVIREGINRGTVFAKDTDPDGKVDLFCSAAGDLHERNAQYKNAVMSVAAAAFSMTGQLGEVEQQRMQHYITEQSKIDLAFEALSQGKNEGGFFVTLNTEDGLVTPREIIDFNEDSYSVTTSNGKEQIVYADANDNAPMILSLKHCVQTGTGQKVYVSREEMNDIMIKTGELKNIFERHDSARSATAYFDEKLAAIDRKYDSVKFDPSRSEKANELKAEKNTLMQAKHLIARSDVYPPTDFDVKRAVLGAQLQDRKFSARQDSQTVEIARVESRCANYGLLQAAKNMDITTRMDLNVEGVSPVIGSNDIREVINSVSVDDFIDSEMRQAEPDINGADQSKMLTVSNVRRESSILRGNISAPGYEGFEAHKQDALSAVNDVSIQMEQVYTPPILENAEVDRTASVRSEEKGKNYILRGDGMLRPAKKVEAKQVSIFDDRAQQPSRGTPEARRHPESFSI